MPYDIADLTVQNAAIFQSDRVAGWYAEQNLCPAEMMILLRRRDAFLGKRVLDLGVGSGRTTRFLLPFAADYVGIDLSPHMLALCRREFPSATLLQMDLRELDGMTQPPFDFVMASWAVLDALAPEARAKALQDISRLTASGGTFVLSAHNREAEIAGRPPAMVWTRRPDRLACEAAHYMIASWNYMRRSHLRHETPEYALFNDMAHHWTGVFYYIDRREQVAQLDRVGFQTIETLGENGRLLGENDDVSADGCLHYVAVKR